MPQINSFLHIFLLSKPMAIYYHSNVGDAKSMQDAVMAIYYHSNVGDAKSMQDAVMAIYYHPNVGDARACKMM